MALRPRQSLIQRKQRHYFADVTHLAHVNPDAVARNLLNKPTIFKGRSERLQIWNLFQQLGGDAVIRRAKETISHARSFAELEAVLHAAALDGWYETGAAVARRFHREVQRLMAAAPGHTPAERETLGRLRALVSAAGPVRAALTDADIRVLLKFPSPRVREIGANAVLALRRKELIDDVLPLCWESGPAHKPAAEAVGMLGESEHAAQLWSRVLSLRRSHLQQRFLHLLRPLGLMGAFDIQVALREWIIEDATVSAASVWVYAEIWSHLSAAKFAAGACDRDEAISDLRWFLNAAGAKRNLASAPSESEHGYLYIARELSRLGANADSEALLARYATQGLPDVDHFPDLLFPGLRGYVREDANNASLMWLAAMGNPDAQDRLLELWLAAFYHGRAPDHWSIHGSLDPARVLAVLKRALRSKAPGVLRRVLSLPMNKTIGAGMRRTVERLSRTHPSNVVRWKARRVLRELPSRRPAQIDAALLPGVRWVRLDAAVLSGVTHIKIFKRPPGATNALPPGLLAPLHANRGYRIEFNKLSPGQRRKLNAELLHGSLARALDRQISIGPSLEERPDVRALRELAPPGNEIDERMSELAQAVMHYWGEGDDLLTLDEEGVGLVATALSSDSASLDDDDKEACGAFVGEALRKAIGGHWSGFDGNYRLEVGSESIDPHSWVREICARSDIVDGAEWLATRFMEAVSRYAPVRKLVARPDPIEACERILTELCSLPASTPMAELMRETRSLTYRFEPQHWPATLLSLDVLIGNPAVNRVLAALAVYAPGVRKPASRAPSWKPWPPRPNATISRRCRNGRGNLCKPE